jgi:D-arabinose 1-dehydrogenase-like Zn-dependent alcohol dehydrogenase
MKALVVQERGGPFVMEERPDPVAGPGEVVARIMACGMGLTIQHTRMGRGQGVKFPLIIGHEITAEIVEVGSGVDPDALRVGDAVTCYFYITCGHCKWCRLNRPPLCANFKGYVGRQIDGAYAEYLKAPASCFIRLPEGLDYKKYPAEVAVLSDAVATPYKVIRRARVAPLEHVAVIGAGGGVGIHMVMMARWAHAHVIAVDVVDEKLEKCREVGAHQTVNAASGRMTEALLDLTGGKGVDIVVDYVSTAKTLTDGIKALGTGGRLVTLGGGGGDIPFEALGRELLAKELEILGSRYCTRQEVQETLELAARGDIWPVVTEKCRFDAQAALTVHERLEKGEILGRAALMIRAEDLEV